MNSFVQPQASKKPVPKLAPATRSTHTISIPAANTESVVLHQCSSDEALDNQTTVEVQKDLNWSENHFPNDLPQKKVFGDQFDAIRDQLLVQTDSWKIARTWTAATTLKGEILEIVLLVSFLFFVILLCERPKVTSARKVKFFLEIFGVFKSLINC